MFISGSDIWYARFTVDRPYGRGYDLTRPISLGLKGGPGRASKADYSRKELCGFAQESGLQVLKWTTLGKQGCLMVAEKVA